MGNVIRFKRPKPHTVKSASFDSLRGALDYLQEPSATVVIVISKDGSFALRSASDGHYALFDLYARAGALLDREKAALIEGD